VADPKCLDGEVREARAATLRLMKQSRVLVDLSDVLIAEAEAAIAALRETMTRTASGGGRGSALSLGQHHRARPGEHPAA